MQRIMIQVKSLVGVVLSVVCVLALSAAAEASALSCRSGQLAVGRGNVYHQAADTAASLHAYFGDISIKKVGPIQKPRLIQQCTNNSRNFEGIAVNFQVAAKSPRGVAKTYLCLTKQKRYVDHTGGWSRWFNVETLCRVGYQPQGRRQIEEGRGNDGAGAQGSVDDGMPVSPDGMYDPDFLRREPNYGPDSTNDGSTPRIEGEFERLPF